MAIVDDTESCCSKPLDNWCSSPKSNHQRIKLQAFHDVLARLQQNHTDLPGLDDQLWLHFNRLPAGYALDVNVDRAEDVLTHINLLRQAQLDPLHNIAFHVRTVQVNSTSNGSMCDAVHSSPSRDEGTQDSVKNCAALGLSLASHPPPAFGLETVGVKFDVEDRDSFANHRTLSSSRAMHEITFSFIDKPKLLSQLTSLLSELDLNIQEAHAFSTVDGFSLDVFVVEGWPHEETEKLRSLLEKEIQNIKSLDLLTASAGNQHQANILHRNVKEEDGSNYPDIDQCLLKMGCKIASGSHGDLYRGTYCGQDVAIKVLKPERVGTDVVKEFFQEVNIMRRLQHKNIVQFVGACTKPPNLFLVTEFMPRGNIYDFMHKRKGVFNFQSLLKAATDVSLGMEYLHQNSILHRDLKTANLLMAEDGVIKVADFGVARIQMLPGVMTAETGTYRWMAPEVISHKPYDHKADVFSFAIVLWELITGELPYSQLSPLQAAIGVVQEGLRPVIPDHANPKLADLLNRCWHQDPVLRPEFSEIISILQVITSEVSTKVVKEEPGSD